MERQEILRQRLLDLGFDVVRFAHLGEPADAMQKGLKDWLGNGYHADMAWMERTAEKRNDPRQVLPSARSAVLLGVNYWPGELSMPQAKWARYALYQDYHDTFKAALIRAGKIVEELFSISGEDYRYYVDSGPVLERGWAERAGVGFIGKNAMLISQTFGNWLFLAELLTSIEFVSDRHLGGQSPSSKGAEAARVGRYCGRCTRCMEACPTDAIRSPGVVDANRCISYQTIENKGIIPRALRAAIGSRIYGCDICLEVCPWNRFAQDSRRVLLVARFDLASLSLVELLALSPERFNEVFRKTPIKRTKLTGLLRNACIVAANTQAMECFEAVIRLCQHPSAVVRVHAVWAAFRLAPDRARERLATSRDHETDAAVLTEYGIEFADLVKLD